MTLRKPEFLNEVKSRHPCIIIQMSIRGKVHDVMVLLSNVLGMYCIMPCSQDRVAENVTKFNMDL